jgi:apolipoprotein N-acyltransferase
VLVNVSNIAWFGDTVAIDQHRHISRLRALELQRPMLRATNTGATAVIDHLGRVTHELPRLHAGCWRPVQGREGLTPYAPRWGRAVGLVAPDRPVPGGGAAASRSAHP